MNKNRLFRQLNTTSILVASAYCVVYLLYLWKYTGDGRPMPTLTLIVFGLVVPLVIWASFRLREIRPGYPGQTGIYIMVLIAVSIGLIAAMKQFNPDHLEIGRYSAINDWIGTLFNGQFPYHGGHNSPSGFPFLFLLAIPFYLLGDVGYLQIAGFLAIGAAVALSHSSPVARLRIILLVVATPIFLFELLVRSDLFSNAAFVALYLIGIDREHRTSNPWVTVAIGSVGGMLLATRGIVLIAYIIYFGYVFRNRNWNIPIFVVSLLSGFAACVLPFLIWNIDFFLGAGPHTVQLSHIPIPLLAAVLLAALVSAKYVRSQQSAFASIGLILFATVFIKLLVSAYSAGISETVRGDDCFDMAYFALGMPFLLLALRFPTRESA